jgi:hypothetical protein
MAAEYCVTCTGPDASYACSIDTGTAAGDDAALKLYCITELAKSGPHASCAVDRAKSAPCDGATRTLAAPAGLELHTGPTESAAPAGNETPQEATSEGAPPSGQSPPPAAANETSVSKPAAPDTVEDLVKDGTESTKEGLKATGEAASDAAKSAGGALEKAGSAIGDAAKKSWNCLTSFFGDC